MLARFNDFAGRRGPLAIILVAGGAILDGFGIVLLVPILSVITSDGGGFAGRAVALLRTLGAVERPAQLAALLAAFAAVMLLRAVTQYARDVTLARLQTGFVEAQRNRVIRALAAASWTTVAGLRHARVANLMSAEIQRLGASVQYLIQGTVAAAMLLIQACLAMLLAPLFASVVLAVLGCGGVILLLNQRNARDLGIEVVRASQTLMGSTSEFLGGLKTAMAQHAQSSFVAEFEGTQDALRSRQFGFLARQARARLNFGVITALCGAALVYLGYSLAGVSPAALIVLVVIFARMSGPALLVQQAAQNFFFGVGSFEAIEALAADLATAAPPPANPGDGPPFGAIELRNVTYAHRDGSGIHGANLRLDPGSFVGLTGVSGAGKTTLVDLLAGLIAPQSGDISVGGVMLGPGNVAAWQDQIGYVAQDGYLFHDTIRRNVSWGAADASATAIERALAITGADALVDRLPEGLETVIGERGALLSGGERQRLNLARALLRQPRLLILDEATNALDLDGESVVLERLKALEPRPTIVAIAHRAESLRHCDAVVQVVSGGVTVGKG